EEKAVTLSCHQLISDEWALGAVYRFSTANLEWFYPSIPAALARGLNRTERAKLHQVQLQALYHHPSGVFARGEYRFLSQQNTGYSAARPGDSLGQINLFVGYRFPRQRAELTLGVLNLTDADYRLNSLTPYTELP